MNEKKKEASNEKAKEYIKTKRRIICFLGKNRVKEK